MDGWESLSEQIVQGQATDPRMLFITGDEDDHLDSHCGQTVNGELAFEPRLSRDAGSRNLVLFI